MAATKDNSPEAKAARKAARKAAKLAAKNGAAAAPVKAEKDNSPEGKAARKAARKAAKQAAKSAAKRSAETPAAEEPVAKKQKVEATPEVVSEAPVVQKPSPIASADGNPKVFCGNLSYDINDDIVKEFFADCGELTDIYWLTDKETGKFFGSGFLTFDSPAAAAKACLKEGQDLCGRPVKINPAKPRAQKSGGGSRAPRGLSERPDGCKTCFMGNLSFNIDEDQMREFAKACGEVTSIRWLTDRESGEFKGCGFIDFATSDGVDEFVKLNGTDLLGRGIRIDYSKPREKKW